jgi:hypothetical protein
MLDQKGGFFEDCFCFFEAFGGVVFGADEVISAVFNDDS